MKKELLVQHRELHNDLTSMINRWLKKYLYNDANDILQSSY